MMTQENQNTILVGLSGPSSSGKTTLARLLKTIFSVDGHVGSFIIHEDDFYYPDNKIPVTRTAKGELIQDWDTIGAIDVTLLSLTLAYVRRHGRLPPRLNSKEDQNEAADSGVGTSRIQALKVEISERLEEKRNSLGSSSSEATRSESPCPQLMIIFIEGFLLYAPPASISPDHVLRSVHDNIDLHMFLPAPYDLVKARRETRTGYVTVGPSPTPGLTSENEQQEEGPRTAVDLEKELDESAPLQNFWVDPPGYVDDIVWPRYVHDHAWLLLAEQGERELEGLAPDDLLKLVGQGTNVRTNVGITIAPGKGRIPMTEILDWAVKEVWGVLESRTRM